MKVRKAHLKDSNEILKLYLNLMAQHDRYDDLYKIHRGALVEYRRFIKQCLREHNSAVLVAQENNRVTGFLICRIEKRLPRFRIRRAAYIYDIYIDKKHQSKGIGRKLIRAMTTWVKRKGVVYIKLEVSPKNKNAFAFWKKMGFHIFQHKIARKIA